MFLLINTEKTSDKHHGLTTENTRTPYPSPACPSSECESHTRHKHTHTHRVGSALSIWLCRRCRVLYECLCHVVNYLSVQILYMGCLVLMRKSVYVCKISCSGLSNPAVEQYTDMHRPPLSFTHTLTRLHTRKAQALFILPCWDFECVCVSLYKPVYKRETEGWREREKHLLGVVLPPHTHANARMHAHTHTQASHCLV